MQPPEALPFDMNRTFYRIKKLATFLFLQYGVPRKATYTRTRCRQSSVRHRDAPAPKLLSLLRASVPIPPQFAGGHGGAIHPSPTLQRRLLPPRHASRPSCYPLSRGGVADGVARMVPNAHRPFAAASRGQGGPSTVRGQARRRRGRGVLE
jgi:hypothetical protein